MGSVIHVVTPVERSADMCTPSYPPTNSPFVCPDADIESKRVRQPGGPQARFVLASHRLARVARHSNHLWSDRRNKCVHFTHGKLPSQRKPIEFPRLWRQIVISTLSQSCARYGSSRSTASIGVTLHGESEASPVPRYWNLTDQFLPKVRKLTRTRPVRLSQHRSHRGERSSG